MSRKLIPSTHRAAHAPIVGAGGRDRRRRRAAGPRRRTDQDRRPADQPIAGHRHAQQLSRAKERPRQAQRGRVELQPQAAGRATRSRGAQLRARLARSRRHFRSFPRAALGRGLDLQAAGRRPGDGAQMVGCPPQPRADLVLVRVEERGPRTRQTDQGARRRGPRPARRAVERRLSQRPADLARRRAAAAPRRCSKASAPPAGRG